MIQHTALFKLKHAGGCAEEVDFLRSIAKLADLPMVKNFRCLRQVSRKNPYDFCVSMEFASEQDYEAYNDHPLHRDFVRQRWDREVSDFMEVDYVALEII